MIQSLSFRCAPPITPP